MLLTIVANLSEGESSRLLAMLSEKDFINIHIHILDYVHHENYCCINSIEDRITEDHCNCGLYDVMKDHLQDHRKYFNRMCNEGE